MRSTFVSTLLAAALALAAGQGPATAQFAATDPEAAASRRAPFRAADPDTGALTRTSYRGYQILLPAGGASPAVLQSVQQQIDIVDSVPLSGSLRRFFQGFPIVVQPGVPAGFSHYRGGRTVTIGVAGGADARPILLHEFLHAYHVNRIPGGYGNAEIRRFYQQALASGAYPPGSYVLSNAAEFYAVTASLFLYGSVARPPYNRQTLRAAQPDYYNYLIRMFGVNPG